MSEYLVLFTLVVIAQLSSANLVSTEEPNLLNVSLSNFTTESDFDKKTETVNLSNNLDLDNVSYPSTDKIDTECVQDCEQGSSIPVNNATSSIPLTSTENQYQPVSTQLYVQSGSHFASTTVIYDTLEEENEIDSGVKDKKQYSTNSMLQNDLKPFEYSSLTTTYQTSSTDKLSFGNFQKNEMNENTQPDNFDQLSTFFDTDRAQGSEIITVVTNSSESSQTLVPTVTTQSHLSSNYQEAFNFRKDELDTTELSNPPTVISKYVSTIEHKSANIMSESAEEVTSSYNATETTDSLFFSPTSLESNVAVETSTIITSHTVHNITDWSTSSETSTENFPTLYITELTTEKTEHTTFIADSNISSESFQYTGQTDDPTNSSIADQSVTKSIFTAHINEEHTPSVYYSTESSTFSDTQNTDPSIFENITDVFHLSTVKSTLSTSTDSTFLLNNETFSQATETASVQPPVTFTTLPPTLNDKAIQTDLSHLEENIIPITEPKIYSSGVPNTTLSTTTVLPISESHTNFISEHSETDEKVVTITYENTEEPNHTEFNFQKVSTLSTIYVSSDETDLVTSSIQSTSALSGSNSTEGLPSTSSYHFSELTSTKDLDNLDPTISVMTKMKEISILTSTIAPFSISYEKHREGKHIPFSTLATEIETKLFKEGEEQVSTSFYESKEIYNQIEFEELRLQDRADVIRAEIHFPAKQNMMEVDYNLAKIHKWLKHVLNNEFKNWTRDPLEATTNYSDDIPFGNVSIFYLKPTPDSNLSQVTLTFIVYNIWRNETLPVAFVLGILKYYVKDLKESINATSTSFTHGLLTEKYDLISAMFEKYSLIIIIIFLAIILVSLLICVILLYRRKSRHSHCLADGKLQHNMKDSVGIDLTPATIILQDEKPEKGNKICDDEGWLVPINQVPVAEDGNTPTVQDTKL